MILPNSNENSQPEEIKGSEDECFKSASDRHPDQNGDEQNKVVDSTDNY